MSTATNVLVYGSLREGFGNHRLLHGSTKLGEINTEPKFTMYSLGGFPGVVPSGNTSIKGEVYSVSESTLRRLDQLEGYPHFYDKFNLETKFGPAVMYILSDEFLSTRSRVFQEVQSGDWANYTSK